MFLSGDPSRTWWEKNPHLRSGRPCLSKKNLAWINDRNSYELIRIEEQLGLGCASLGSTKCYRIGPPMSLSLPSRIRVSSTFTTPNFFHTDTKRWAIISSQSHLFLPAHHFCWGIQIHVSFQGCTTQRKANSFRSSDTLTANVCTLGPWTDSSCLKAGHIWAML